MSSPACSNASSLPNFYLASQSPRRREILQQIGVLFVPISVDVVEVREPDEDPLDYVQRLACAKAAAGLAALNGGAAVTGWDGVILGADTIVIGPAGEVLEKPSDCEQCVLMLQQLSGQTHSVVTAVSLTNGRQQMTRLSHTRVTFRELSACECVDYWHTGEPHDKAGGYAIQGLGAVFVESIQGSYSGVVGLPIETLLPLLKEFSVPWWGTTDKALSPYE